MKYMLDTNICIYVLKERPESVLKKFKQIRFGDVGISSIVLSELQYGVEKSQHRKKSQEKIDVFGSLIELIEYDDEAARSYGKIRADLEKKGQVIGNMDLLIAAHALSIGSTLATNNVKEFKRVKGLKIVNWV